MNGASLAFGRFRRLPQRAGDVWQGGFVRLPAWIDHPADPQGEPYRPVAAMWVSLRTGLMHVALAPADAPPSPEFALDALIAFGLKWSKGLDGRPARVEVRDPQLHEALAEPLSRLATPVVLVDDLQAVAEVLRHLESEATGGRRFPGILESPGIDVDRLRAFADAAADFYRARVWDHLANEDLIIVDGHRLPRRMRHVAVLGQGGEQFGVSFFDSRRAFERVIDATDPRLVLRRAHGVTFGSIDELPFADVDAWQDYALPLAGSRAYPLAAELGPDGLVRRPDAGEITYAEALLRALAATSEGELDTGRWQKRVATCDGERELTFSLPLLLEAERVPDAGHGTGSPRPGRGAGMPAAERASARVARLLEGRSFESLDDLNAELGAARTAGLFDLPPDAAAGRALTPQERAQELAYDAMEADGRLRIKRARQALAISPDCADAWLLLAEAASTSELARERYEEAVAAGVRALGDDRFAELEGEFWGHLETRPYMRARLGLAGVLRSLGCDDEAVEHYRALLRLNPGDNQGVRYLLVAALLDMGRNAEAGALLDEHEPDMGALWPYARMVWTFRVEGDTAAARAAFDRALRANPHAIAYLLDPDAMPFSRPPHFALGSPEEGVYVAETLGGALDATGGARAWLLSQAVRAHPRRSRKPRSRPRRS